jgi:hypothetical protein
MNHSRQSSKNTRPVLTPDDLRLAADTFGAALRRLDESTCRVHPYTARQMLARYIIEQSFRGPQDPEVLCDAALEYLEQKVSKGSI